MSNSHTGKNVKMKKKNNAESKTFLLSPSTGFSGIFARKKIIVIMKSSLFPFFLSIFMEIPLNDLVTVQYTLSFEKKKMRKSGRKYTPIQ